MSNNDNLDIESTENKAIEEMLQKYGLDIAADITVYGVISDLKLRIEKFAEDSKTLEEHILELAKRLDGSNACQRDQICKKIKEILKDKINQGKITERWIEKCLPDEYKRKYTNQEASKRTLEEQDKSEVSSLLSNKGNEQNTILIGKPNDNNSKCKNYENKDKDINSIDTSDNDQDNAIASLQKTNLIEECFNCFRLNKRNQELEEIVSKNITFENAQNLQSKILKISVEKKDGIQNALNKSIKYCIAKFDENGWLHDVISDSLQDIEKRKVFKNE